MELVKAIDQLDQHVFAAPDVPLTQQVRLERSLLRASMSVIRIRAYERFGAERSGAVGELFRALDALDAAVAAAKGIPSTEQVRFDKDGFRDLIADLRDTLMPAVREQGGEAAPWADAMDQVAALERMVDDAPRSTFTRKIRLDADQLRDVAARLRIAATRAPEKGELSAVLARLDEIVREAPPTGEAKISAIVLYVIVVDLRDAVLAAA